MLAFILYNLLYAMAVFNYKKCVETDPGQIPPGWTPPNASQGALLALRPVSNDDE